jgi:hypothetical protein
MAAAAAHGDEEVQDDTVVGTINELIDAKIIESVIEDPRNEFVRKFGTSGTEPQKWMAERMTGTVKQKGAIRTRHALGVAC